MASSLRFRSEVDYKLLHEGEPLNLKKGTYQCKTVVLEKSYDVERLIWRRNEKNQNFDFVCRTFSIDCDEVHARIVTIIKKWADPYINSCQQGGDRCLYKLISENTTEVEATYETPTSRFKADLTFNFKTGAGNTGCDVEGHSTSDIVYVVLDYGINYCTLHNLISPTGQSCLAFSLGAGLNKDPSYTETTSDARCMQYSIANCN